MATKRSKTYETDERGVTYGLCVLCNTRVTYPNGLNLRGGREAHITCVQAARRAQLTVHTTSTHAGDPRCVCTDGRAAERDTKELCNA